MLGSVDVVFRVLTFSKLAGARDISFSRDPMFWICRFRDSLVFMILILRDFSISDRVVVFLASRILDVSMRES